MSIRNNAHGTSRYIFGMRIRGMSADSSSAGKYLEWLLPAAGPPVDPGGHFGV